MKIFWENQYFIFCPSNINIIQAKKRKKKKKNFQPKLLKAGFCLLGSEGNLNSNLNAWRKFLIMRFGDINLTFADVLISDNGYSQTDHKNALCFVRTRKTATLIRDLPSARNNSLQQLCPCVQVINKRVIHDHKNMLYMYDEVFYSNLIYYMYFA